MNAQDLAGLPTREALVSRLREDFAHLSATDTAVSPIRGGRDAALAALNRINPQAYERTRNFLTGDVTRLSPYLRHGVLTLAEVRDHALTAVRDPDQAEKLINEFAWRDYWQRIYYQIGDGVWQDRELPKTGFAPSQYAHQLAQNVVDGTTTLACVDAFSTDLTSTGYLHNHARMWLAAYIVHWLRVRWQAGARWFLEHLLDGDPASNNLSWQWVSSTFSTKPYIFNRENLERYTGGVYCRACPHAAARTCPFEASYEELTDKLFPRLGDPQAFIASRGTPQAHGSSAKPSMQPAGQPLLWIHTDSLNPELAALTAAPGSPALFVWDNAWLVSERISLKRVLFLAECLQSMPAHMEIRIGDPGIELLAAARASQATHILAMRTPDPRLQAAALLVERHIPVVWIDPPPFVERVRDFDLKRFSRYWQRAQSSALQPTRR